MGKPTVGSGTQGKEEEEGKVFSPTELDRAYSVIFHEGPEAAEKAGLQNEARATSVALNKVVNYHKGPIAKLRDALFDTDIGAGVELLAVGGVAAVAGYSAYKLGGNWLKKHKDNKETVIDSETPLSYEE